MGTKRWVAVISLYFSIFSRSARLATAPGPFGIMEECDGANVSGHVASHTKIRPIFQGMVVASSGRFPSDWEIPDGSRRNGTLAVARERLIMSLMAVCQEKRP